MAQILSCSIPISLVLVPLILVRRRWSSPAIGFTTGAIATVFVELWDIAQNGVDYGPLQIGPAVYILRYATGVAVVGVIVWAAVSGLRRLASSKPPPTPIPDKDGHTPRDSSPKVE